MSDPKMPSDAPPPPATLGDVGRDLCRQFRTSFWAAVAAKQAERDAPAAGTPAGDPAPGLTDDELANLHRLLKAWPGKGREDAQA